MRRGPEYVLALALLTIGTRADAQQMQWSRSTALAYGLLGAAVGVVPAMDMSFEEPFWLPPLAGMTAGALFGHFTGESAERKLARGQELGIAHRNVLRGGTVMLGIWTGAAVASLAIDPDGPNRLGSDEAILGAGLLGGAVLGLWLQTRLEPKLRPDAVEPSVGYSPQRGARFALRYRTN